MLCSFSSEYLKVFFRYIGVFIVFIARSINYGYTNNILSITERHGNITLLPKGDKSRHHFKIWRLITLLYINKEKQREHCQGCLIFLSLVK